LEKRLRKLKKHLDFFMKKSIDTYWITRRKANLVLSTTAEYALRALVSLAKQEPGKAVLGRELSSLSGVPANYLSKILLEVKKAGLVQAVRGTGGGYRLGRRPEEIRLIDIVEPIDGTRTRPGCLLSGGQACSDDDPCSAHERWAVVRDTYVAFLESTTLATLAAHPNRGGGA
jgi:Rrf2 family iron-sulfur cluster assembly transcriptional regulator